MIDKEKKKIYNQRFKEKHPEKYKSAREKWKKNHMDKEREYQKRYADNNPLKIKAHQLSRKIELIKEICKLCGSIKNLEFHHQDYSHPLDVIVLCRKCHKSFHRDIRGLK